MGGPFEVSPIGFAEFIEWLERGNLNSNSHWAPQRRAMLPLHYYDRLLPQERLGESLRQLLVDVGENPSPDLFVRAPSGEGRHNHYAEQRIRKFYSPLVAESVSRIYSADFAGLEYSPDILELRQ